MEAIWTNEIITEEGISINLPELKKFINQKVDVLILPTQNSDDTITLNHQLQEIIKLFGNDPEKVLSIINKPKRNMKDFRGVLKGKIRLTDDFNAPLDVLKDYTK